jgi:hypothetical protein
MIDTEGHLPIGAANIIDAIEHFPLAFLAGLDDSGRLPVSWGGAIAVRFDGRFHIAVGMPMASDGRLPVSFASHFSTDSIYPFSLGRLIDADAILPWSATAGLSVVGELPISWGGAVAIDVDGHFPVGFIGNMSMDGRLPLSSIRMIPQDGRLPVSWAIAVLALVSDGRLPVSWAGQVEVLADGYLPVAWGGAIAVLADGHLPIAWSLDAFGGRIPISWGGCPIVSTQYDSKIALALRLIQKYGQQVILRDPTGNAPSGSLPWRPGISSYREQTVPAVFLDESMQYTAGDMIRSGKLTAYIPASGLTIPVEEDGIIIRCGLAWKIIDVMPLAPNGKRIMYIVTLER